MKRRISLFTLVGFISVSVLSPPRSAHAWGNAGHEIVAYIAADNLNTPARRTIAKLLRAPEDQIGNAMATAALLPDNEFRQRDPATYPVALC